MADDDKKPWGEDFDAERAWKLIQDLRADKVSLKRERDEARQERDAATTERDEAVKASDTAKKELASDRRAAILREFDIDEDDAEEFLPDGLTLDELRRKAERLSKRSKPKDDKENDTEDKSQEDESGDADSKDDDGDSGDELELPGRPKPALRSGAGSEPKTAPDLDAIAAAARRRN